jgi:peptidyl-prolyl cis-trans isomerase A (cyclophilin A)
MKPTCVKRLLASMVVLGGFSALPAQAQQYVCMDSTLGMFCLQLLNQQAPLTVNNFLSYVTSGAYDDTIVHRSEWRASGEKFVIQSGGYSIDDSGRISAVPGAAPVPNEFSVSNQRGTVAMATIAGRPNSATSQWFVNLGDNAGVLDYQNGGFTVFAQVVSGMDVVDSISNLGRANLSATLGPAFSEVPVATAPGTTWVQTSDLVVIRHAYALEHLPSVYHCGLYSPQDTITELCGDTLTLPVRIGDEVYSATLERDYSGSGLSATVDMNSLRLLREAPAQSAEYDAAKQTLYIPSVRIGEQIYNDVVWQLSDKQTMRFTLISYATP